VSDPKLTPEQEFDLIWHGRTFIDSDGNRIDPATVVMCHCTQAPWYPPCRHNGGER
jgi:hypothetical protein